MHSLIFPLVLALQSQSPTDDLKSLQGTWEVRDPQSSSGIKFVLPPETGLAKKGSQVTISGNEVRFDGKVVATITLDFAATGLNVEKQVISRRRPILLTLPDGKGILLAYQITGDSAEMVHPHTIGNVGAGSFLYLGRPAKKAVAPVIRSKVPSERMVNWPVSWSLCQLPWSFFPSSPKA